MAFATAAQTYARIGLETSVAAASPARLVVMLYDGALGAIADARRHQAAGKVALRGRSLGHAMAIVREGLRASLDTSRGGEIAHQLSDLYLFIELRLFTANSTGADKPLAEAAALLADLREAWVTLAENGPRAPRPVN